MKPLLIFALAMLPLATQAAPEDRPLYNAQVTGAPTHGA